MGFACNRTATSYRSIRQDQLECQQEQRTMRTLMTHRPINTQYTHWEVARDQDCELTDCLDPEWMIAHVIQWWKACDPNRPNRYEGGGM